MRLDLTLFQIEDGLRDLYAMREEARENLVAAQNASGILGTFPEETELEAIDDAIRLYIGAEIKKTDGVADFILMLDRLCHEQRERKGSVERCQIDQEIDRLKARRDSLRGVLAHVKDAVKFVMEGMPWREGKPKKLEGVRHSITLRGNGGAQPVEITDESLVPDEYCRVTVTMTANQWRNLLAAANIPSAGKWLAPELWTPSARVTREISRSAIAEALAKPCQKCAGNGYIEGQHIQGVGNNCIECGGSGTAGVPGCRLLARGESVVIK